MADTFQEIRANAFTLVDSEGSSRGGLLVSDNRAKLCLKDKSGHTRLQADVSEEGNAQLIFADQAGVCRLGMDLYPEGPSFFLCDSVGNVIIGLDFEEASGQAVISMYDSSKHVRLTLQINAKAPESAIKIYDDQADLKILLAAQGELPGISTLDDTKVKVWISGDSVLLSGAESSRIIKPDGDVASKPGGDLVVLRAKSGPVLKPDGDVAKAGTRPRKRREKST